MPRDTYFYVCFILKYHNTNEATIMSPFKLPLTVVAWIVCSKEWSSFRCPGFIHHNHRVNSRRRETYTVLRSERPDHIPSDPGDDGTGGQNGVNADREHYNGLALQQQADRLREEITAMRNELDEQRRCRELKRQNNVDRWIEHILVRENVNTNTQLLNTVEDVVRLLRDERFSFEQVNQMFDRLCELSPAQCRSRCSPILELLVDAAGKLDEMERVDNPNKRWNGQVERHLRKRLFAKDWGMDIDYQDEGVRHI